jgi:hypothetical protein
VRRGTASEAETGRCVHLHYERRGAGVPAKTRKDFAGFRCALEFGITYKFHETITYREARINPIKIGS